MLPLSRSEGFALTAILRICAVCLKRIEISEEENWSKERMSLFLNLPFIASLLPFLAIKNPDKLWDISLSKQSFRVNGNFFVKIIV